MLAIMIIGWILICAVCADIALQTNEHTGNAFGWASVRLHSTLHYMITLINIMIILYDCILTGCCWYQHCHVHYIACGVLWTNICTP